MYCSSVQSFLQDKLKGFDLFDYVSKSMDCYMTMS